MDSTTRDIREIRRLMEQSTRFISLSGLSGVLAGLYALAGVWLVREYFLPASDVRGIVFTGLVVLVLALATAAVLSARNARRQGIKVFSKPVRLLLLNLAIPLLTGGIYTLILLGKDHYDLLASGMLLFYGLSLINASKYTADYIRTLGYIEILLGLIAAAYPVYGLLFWSVGFGWLHILYGSYVYWKIER